MLKGDSETNIESSFIKELALSNSNIQLGAVLENTDINKVLSINPSDNGHILEFFDTSSSTNIARIHFPGPISDIYNLPNSYYILLMV